MATALCSTTGNTSSTDKAIPFGCSFFAELVERRLPNRLIPKESR